MLKIVYCVAMLIFFNVAARAQRFSLPELIKIYGVATDPNSMSSTITESFGNQGNWSSPTFKKDQHQTIFNWNYVFGGAVMGVITVYRDNNDNLPTKLSFKFPYSIQYDDYRSQLVRNAKLVNVFSEGQKSTEVYELENIVFALTVYPAELNVFFNEGRSVALYKILIQHKGFKQ